MSLIAWETHVTLVNRKSLLLAGFSSLVTLEDKEEDDDGGSKEKEKDQAKRVNVGFQQWEFHKIKGCKTEARVDVFLLDQWVILAG